MAEQEMPRGPRRTAWNIVIVLIVIAIVVAIFIAVLGGGGQEETSDALIHTGWV